MAKGAKKRRANRKKQKKAHLHVQVSCPSGKVEFCPLEENGEDVFSPKTPVQSSEGEDKDRMFDMVGGSASPSSHTEEVVISKRVEYESGFCEKLGPHEFLAFGAEGIGDSEGLESSGPSFVVSKASGMNPLRNINLNNLEHNEHGKDIIFDNLEQDDAETSKQLRDELGDFYRLNQSANGSVEKLETHISPAYQAHHISLSERLENGASEHEGLQFLQEQIGHEKETNLDNSESSVLEMLQNADNYKSDDAAAPQMLQNATEVTLSICNSPGEFCMTSEGVCSMSSSPALFDRKNPEKMESTMALEHEDPQLLHKEYIDVHDLCLKRSDRISVEVINQPKNGTVANVNIQGTVTNMLKEDPFFEGLVVSFPATEPGVDTANPLVPTDLEPRESFGVAPKHKSKDDNGREFGDIGEGHAQQTQSLKHNGQDKDIHTRSILPGELDRGGKANDMVLQSKRKFGRDLNFCGLLEFLLCWRD